MNFGKISAATIARTAVLLLALTNQVLSALGKPMLPIESQTVEQLVTAGITTVAALISWWNNNSFTSAAIQADAEYARRSYIQGINTVRHRDFHGIIAAGYRVL